MVFHMPYQQLQTMKIAIDVIAMCRFIVKYIKEVITPYMLFYTMHFLRNIFLLYCMNIMYIVHVVEKLIFVHVIHKRKVSSGKGYQDMH